MILKIKMVRCTFPNEERSGEGVIKLAFSVRVQLTLEGCNCKWQKMNYQPFIANNSRSKGLEGWYEPRGHKVYHVLCQVLLLKILYINNLLVSVVCAVNTFRIPFEQLYLRFQFNIISHSRSSSSSRGGSRSCGGSSSHSSSS